MRQDVELNDSQERKLNRVKKKVLRNKEKIENTATVSKNRKAAVFNNSVKQDDQEKKSFGTVL